MGFFDFLRIRENHDARQSAEAKISGILANLQALEDERAKLNEAIADHSNKREQMLLDDNVTDADVVKHDLTLERSHVRLERLAALEEQLCDDLSAAQGEISEREFRSAFDARHAAGQAYADALAEVITKLEAFRKAHGAFAEASRKLRRPISMGDEAPYHFNGELHRNFVRGLTAARDGEDARRERLDGEQP